MNDNRDKIKVAMLATFNTQLDARINRFFKTRFHNVIPNQYFSNASAESVNLFINGHPYGCISLCQAIAESLSRFICSSNKVKIGKDFRSRVDKLSKEKLISTRSKLAFHKIWGNDRDTFHHLNENITTDYNVLIERAEECLTALSTIESEIFAYKLSNNAIVPLKPIYWSKPKDGLLEVFLKSPF
jgi:hypothetical protein